MVEANAAEVAAVAAVAAAVVPVHEEARKRIVVRAAGVEEKIVVAVVAVAETKAAAIKAEAPGRFADGTLRKVSVSLSLMVAARTRICFAMYPT